MPRLDVSRFLEDLTGRHAQAYTEVVRDMVVAMARGNTTKLGHIRKRLEKITTETMGMGEVLGATLALRRAATIAPEITEVRAQLRQTGQATMGALCDPSPSLVYFRDTPIQTILPRITLTEAVQDMVERTPATIRNAAERTAQRISQLYSEGRVVAFARSAEQAVTERVQSLIQQAIRDGIPEAETGRLIKMSVDEIRTRTAAWTDGYARMAFRTNVNTAVTAGRFRQAQDPDIKAVIPAFRFDDAGDVDVRPNHHAADGKIFRVDNPVWNRLAPPLGWN